MDSKELHWIKAGFVQNMRRFQVVSSSGQANQEWQLAHCAQSAKILTCQATSLEQLLGLAVHDEVLLVVVL